MSLIVDFSKCLAQTKAHKALLPGNTICMAFGRGVGKSTCMRLFWYLLIAQWDGKFRKGSSKPGVRIVLLMPTLKQAIRTHDLMLGELSKDGDWGFLGGKVNQSTWTVRFPGGSWIRWVSAENANDNRGIRCDVVGIDEADDVLPEIFSAICIPWLSEPHSLGIKIITGTPRRGRYGLLYKAFAEWPRQTDNCFSFHATGYDAPELVSPKALAEAKRITPEEVFKREWMCDFDAAEGLVYPMFSHATHVREPFLPFHSILVGIDHGFEDPTVFEVIGIHGHGLDATAHVIWEWSGNHKSIDELADIAQEIHVNYPMAKWYADSSGAIYLESYKRRIRKHIMGATHPLDEGIPTVQALLTPREDAFGMVVPKLYVAPRCKLAIEEFGKYRRKRDPKNPERVLEDLEDRNNHALDALRYPLFQHFGGFYSPKHIAAGISTDQY